jgi:hypothetical protein
MVKILWVLYIYVCVCVCVCVYVCVCVCAPPAGFVDDLGGHVFDGHEVVHSSGHGSW